MNNLSVDGEFRYIVTWFNEWSELQRDDFVPVLVDLLTKDMAPANGSPGAPNINGIAGRPAAMSLFQCRIKLFREWTPKWPDELKQQLKEKIMEMDTNIAEKIMNEIKGHSGHGALTLNGDGHCNGNADDDHHDEVIVSATVTATTTAALAGAAGEPANRHVPVDNFATLRLDNEASVDGDDVPTAAAHNGDTTPNTAATTTTTTTTTTTAREQATASAVTEDATLEPHATNAPTAPPHEPTTIAAETVPTVNDSLAEPDEPVQMHTQAAATEHAVNAVAVVASNADVPLLAQ